MDSERGGREMRSLWFLGIAILFTGCVVVRSYTVETPRTDLDIQGNRGYLSGSPSEPPPPNRLGNTRQVSVVEVEFDTPAVKKKRRKAESSIPEEKLTPDEELVVEEVVDINGEETEDSEIIETMDFEEVSFPEQEYTVKKNDTLQKISHQFYGTTRKWKEIYEANTDILKSPDKVYPGMKLRIPDLSEWE